MSDQPQNAYLEQKALRLQELARKDDRTELIAEIKKMQRDQRYWCWSRVKQLPVPIRSKLQEEMIMQAILNAEVLEAFKELQ